MNKNKISIVNSPLESIDSSVFRDQVITCVRKFKTNWMELAKYLFIVKKNKYFKEWGYLDFDTYCTKEIGIKKQTAFKLLNSYYFLAKEESHFLEQNTTQSKDPISIPHYESIDVLRRAKLNKQLKESDYKNLRENVFEHPSEPREVGRQFRSMLLSAKGSNPEEDREKRKICNIKRIISTLRSLKKEAELLHFIPDQITKDTDKLLLSLENIIGKQS